MDNDDGIRAKNGIVVCARRLSDGRIRLVFDDVKTDSPVRNTQWKYDCFYTHGDLNADNFIELNLSEERLADIGALIIARLSVYFKKDGGGT